MRAVDVDDTLLVLLVLVVAVSLDNASEELDIVSLNELAEETATN